MLVRTWNTYPLMTGVWTCTVIIEINALALKVHLYCFWPYTKRFCILLYQATCSTMFIAVNNSKKLETA